MFTTTGKGMDVFDEGNCAGLAASKNSGLAVDSEMG